MKTPFHLRSTNSARLKITANPRNAGHSVSVVAMVLPVRKSNAGVELSGPPKIPGTDPPFKVNSARAPPVTRTMGTMTMASGSRRLDAVE